MHSKKFTVHEVERNNSYGRYAKILFAYLALFFFLSTSSEARENWPGIVPSGDGTPISYEICGEGVEGAPVLVFVHGWSCDSRYWRAQIPYFSPKYRMVLVDLAGHGHSGSERSDYTMQSFGEDVRAVVEAVGAEKVILIGHSMGGIVIAEAARLMPEKVLGLIGVDTLEDLEYPLSAEGKEQMLAPFREDFPIACREFVRSMLYPETDAVLQRWILDDMAAASPVVGRSAMDNMLDLYVTGELATLFEGIPLPVIVVNGDLWPANFEANRRHMHSFDVLLVERGDHFLMMHRSEEFNKALEEAIRRISKE